MRTQAYDDTIIGETRKGKVKLSLVFNYAPHNGNVWEVEVEFHEFFISALDEEGQLHVPAALPPRKDSRCTLGHSWVVPKS